MKRVESLEIVLETVHAHILELPRPVDHQLERDERKLLELDNIILFSQYIFCHTFFLLPSFLFAKRLNLETLTDDLALIINVALTFVFVVCIRL
jgi:hypothetical protein